MTREGLERGCRARGIRMTRTALGLAREAFAGRVRVPVATLRDREPARVMPPDGAAAGVRAIARHPGPAAAAAADRAA